MRKLIAILCLVVAGCTVPATAIKQTDNQNVKLELLFEHDGVKVYRFTDANHFVYYADARGSVVYETTESAGKTTYTLKHEVTTVK